MVKKTLISIIFITIITFIFILNPVVFASGLSVQIEQPKSPTNQNSFNINFVTLDNQNRAVTVKCYKKGPSDGSFSKYGSDINLVAGGNTGNCAVTSSVMNTDGVYQFNVTAEAGGDSATSQTVNVELKTQSPGTPTSYSKSKSICDYKIEFTTADDSGRTSKVEVYRSENTSFNVDNGSKVGQVFIGSNVNGSFINTPPDCSKNYYYAIRAFDSVGNGSGIVGDSITVVVSPSASATPATALSGAIPVSGGTDVLGESATSTAEGQKNSSDTTSPNQQEVSKEPSNSSLWGKIISSALLALALFYLWKRYKK